MNGPRHYREAEDLVRRSGGIGDPEMAKMFVAQAQVHTTLALAAACGGSIASSWPVPGDVLPASEPRSAASEFLLDAGAAWREVL
mgnify:FL=1